MAVCAHACENEAAEEGVCALFAGGWPVGQGQLLPARSDPRNYVIALDFAANAV